MFRELELLLFELVRWFYTLPTSVGLLTIGIGAIGCLLAQFFFTGRTFIPGSIGLFLFLAEGYHLVNPGHIIKRIDDFTSALQYPTHATLPAFPILEPLFSFFVAPLESRMIYEESVFVALAAYIFFASRACLSEYNKTGVIIGKVSLKSIINNDDYKRPLRSASNELGSGDLANNEQIAKWTKSTGSKWDTSLNVNTLRGSQGIAFPQAKLVIPAEERSRHMLVVAKTGSGKSTRFIYPIIYNDALDPERSAIVIDSKPEMWRKFAALTRKYCPEKNIMLFNPLDRARSLSWNILAKIQDDTDCKLISNTLIMATDVPSAKSDSPFFRNNALAILNSIMIGLLHDPNERLSMPRIHEIVQSGMKPLCEWLEAHPHAIRNTRTFVDLARSGSQNADTIMSELSMRLAAWDLTAIRSTTFLDELNIEELVTKPTLLIVEFRESELEMLRPMANVIVVELLRFLTKYAEGCPNTKLPRPVGFVIDEFASALGRLPDIHVKLNTLRSRNVSIVAAIQSTAQIKANYGDDADSVLAGFSTKIFMPSLDLADAEWASKETGQMTIRFQTESKGNNKKIIEWFASRNDSKQEQVQQRAVLTPDEIGRPADNISTFFLPNTPVFQGHLVPSYKIAEMNKRINEFDSEELELKLRTAPIPFEEKMPESKAGSAPGGAPAAGVVGANGLPPGITDTRGWSDDQIIKKLEEVKKQLDWENTTGSARKWWEAFEAENKTKMNLVLRLSEELLTRKATITEFFLAYVYSNTDNIQANLSYLDYTRLKREEEKKKRDAAAKSFDSGPFGASGTSGTDSGTGSGGSSFAA